MEINVVDSEFDENVIEKSKELPVVVDFWAEWCQPCKMLKPVMEKFAKEYKGKFLLAKVDVEEASATSEKFGISSIPAVKMFKNGKVVSEFTGSLPEDSIKKWLDENL